MGSDDEYGGLPDEALAAALDAAERQQPARSHASNSAAPPQPRQQPTPQKLQQKVIQPTPQKVSRAGGGAVIVSTRQKGNPILSHIKNVSWEYGPAEMGADYLVGASAAVLFLSLKYHKLHPDYIHTRIRGLGTAYNLRLLLVFVDIADHADPLRQLTKTCVLGNLTLLLSWSSSEAGRYLEAFKMFEHAPPTAIMEKVSEDYGTRMVEVFTRVRGVNKTDAVTLVSTFGSVRRAVNASPEEVLMISGWGQQKVGRLERAVQEPFRVGKRRKASESGKGRGWKVAEAPTGRADVAARLGLGTTLRRLGASEHEAWVIDDDEDALAAVAAMEAAEEQARLDAGEKYGGRSTVWEGSSRPAAGSGASQGKEKEKAGGPEDELPSGPPPEFGAGIMAALEKMRQRTQ